MSLVDLVKKKTVDTTMGTNYAPLVIELIWYPYTEEFIQKQKEIKKKPLKKFFTFICRY